MSNLISWSGVCGQIDDQITRFGCDAFKIDGSTSSARRFSHGRAPGLWGALSDSQTTDGEAGRLPPRRPSTKGSASTTASVSVSVPEAPGSGRVLRQNWDARGTPPNDQH